MVTMVIDIEKRQPGCAIVQACYGADHGALLAQFPAKSWITHPTEGMRLITAPESDFLQLAAECRERFGV